MNDPAPLTGFDIDDPHAYGAAFAEVYDRWYEGVTNAEATADFVDRVSPPGPVLELGVGTGRLARPLTQRGRTVVGVDSSAPMLGQCSPQAAYRVQADMRALPISGEGCAAALIAFNTLFNVATIEGQRQTLTDAAHSIAADGVVIVEAIDGTLLGHSPSASVGVSRLFANGVVVSATDVNPIDQTITGHHLDIGNGGIIVRPWRLRWLTPGQLDVLAAEAGLTLEHRQDAWAEGEPSSSTAAPSHISVYRRS